MEYLKAILLGIIQGLTEFLPISSSGHLILAERWGLGEPSLTMNILLHVGTLLAVLVVFYKQIFELIKKPFSKMVGYYVLACIPTGIIALLFKYYFMNALMGSILPFCFMVSAFLLIMAEIFSNNTTDTLSAKNAFLTGVSQGFAVLPGISRSGATISTLMLLGVEKEQAAEFSFILSIPIIIASAVSELIHTSADIFLSYQIMPIICGMVSAFISGIFAIKIMLKIIKNKSFWPFAIYLVIMSVVSFITLF